MPCATEGIEDRGVEGSSERVLSVLREAVVDDAFLWCRACKEGEEVSRAV